MAPRDGLEPPTFSHVDLRAALSLSYQGMNGAPGWSCTTRSCMWRRTLAIGHQSVRDWLFPKTMIAEELPTRTCHWFRRQGRCLVADVGFFDKTRLHTGRRDPGELSAQLLLRIDGEEHDVIWFGWDT